MTDWTRDLRYAARALRKAPSFAVVSIGIFGVAIAAATVVFSLVSSVYLRPLPFAKPDALVLVQQESATPDCSEACPVVTTLRSLRTWTTSVASIGEIAGGRIARQVAIRTPSVTLMPRGAAVSVNFFPMLGVHTAFGRVFSAADLDESAPNAIILSYSLWSSAFGADSSVIGRTTDLGGRPFRVIGVMPATAGIGAPMFDADGPSVAYYVPLGRSEPDEADIVDGYTIVGRLHVSGSGSELAARAAGLLTMGQAGNGTEVTNASKRASARALVLPLSTAYAKPFVRLYDIFFVGVLFLGLVTCTNLAGLFAVRLASRRNEVAIRTALGASRMSLVRRFVIEGIIIGSLGGALGFALGRIAIGFVRILPSSVIPYWTTIEFDRHVILLGFLCSVLLSALFALGPAIALSSSPAMPRTHEIAGVGSDRGVISISHALVGFEIACTLILLTGAGLFTKTFVSIARRDPGIAQHSVVVGELYAHGLGFDQPDQQRLLAHSVLDQLSRLPSVAAFGIFGRGETAPILNIALAQGASVASSGGVPRSVISTSPDYFRAAGVALLAGREFRNADRLSAPPVAILDEVAAERLFGKASPIGQRIKFGLASSALPWVEIVGVVRAVTGTRLIPAHQPRPTIYVPIDQVPTLGLSFAVRTRGPSSQALPAIREALHTAAPNVPIAILNTIEARLSDEIAPARTNLVMIGVFACVALILASLAVYGVVSHVVMQRRGEFAIRLALGARGRDIIRLALRRVGAVTFVGLAVGAASSWALVRFLRALLYGTSPTDTGVFAGAILLVLAISFTAAVLGARRVGLIDPASALRG